MAVKVTELLDGFAAGQTAVLLALMLTDGVTLACTWYTVEYTSPELGELLHPEYLATTATSAWGEFHFTFMFVLERTSD